MGATPAGNIQNSDDIFLRLTHFIDTASATSRFLIVGTSLGAYLGRALTNKYSEQVDGLLLRVPLIRAGKRDFDPFQRLLLELFAMAATPETQQALLETILIQTPEYISKLQTKFDQAVSPALKAADNVILDRIRSDELRYRLSPQYDAGNNKSHDPTLVLTARQDDAVGHRDWLSLLELCPRSTYAILDRATHVMPLDDQAVFEALVKKRLSRPLEWQETRAVPVIGH